MNPNLIIHNAQIYTVDPTNPWAEAVACYDGIITAVGRNDDIVPLTGPDTDTINAGGRLVLPGLIDSHVHFLNYAMRRKQVSLFGVTDFSEVRQRIQKAVKQREMNLWVQGWGWDESRWDVAPSAALLDAIAPDIPIVLARVDMHTYWVNGAVLKLTGITRETPDPPEARIERDSNGNPTGILREWNALRLVDQHIPRPDQEILHRWLIEAVSEAHRLGVTGIHDQRVEREGRLAFRLWQKLRREGNLKLRVHMNVAADFIPEVMALGLQPGFGDDRLWLGHLKVFADGTLGSQTAWMLQPFEGSADNTGIPVTTAGALTELALQAAKAGFSLSVHAIGDRAVREVAAVMSEFPANAVDGQLPHRIEHVQVINPNDLSQLAQNNIYAAVQPVHIHLDWRTANRVWGKRGRYTYAFRSLLDHGTVLAFGSDAPVAPLNPMLGIQAALTRQDPELLPEGGWYPEERISLDEALYAYTMAPARLSGKASQQGSVTPGKWADMIILEQNLFDLDPTMIPDVRVAATIVAGEIVGRW